MKHGKGQLLAKGARGPDARGEVDYHDQRYVYDKKDGIFVIRYEELRDKTIQWRTFIDDEETYISKRVSKNGLEGNFYTKDRLADGKQSHMEITFNLANHTAKFRITEGDEVPYNREYAAMAIGKK